MEGLFRRRSGVYVARLAVPYRLRDAVGQTEMIESTGTRDLAIARIVAGGLVMRWRHRFLELDSLKLGMEFDVLKVTAGSLALALGDGHLPLSAAAVASGIGEDALLREAAGGGLKLLVRVHRVAGFALALAALDRNPEGGWDVPDERRMPDSAIDQVHTGLLRSLNARMLADSLLAGEDVDEVLFGLGESRESAFAPNALVAIRRGSIEMLASEVEAFRRRAAALVTPDQIEQARAGAHSSAAEPAHARRPLRDSIDNYLSDHKYPRGDEQARRVSGACKLFLELMGPELRGCDLDRDKMRNFRDAVLPQVPAKENKVRLMHKTTCISESIRAIEGSDWPRLSAEEQVKRIGWVAGWMDWLGREGWAEPGLMAGIAGAGTSGRKVSSNRKKRKDQDRRDAFSDADLALIFGADWFKVGRGKLTVAGTYRTWMPGRYWLPLLGLLTGARIGELAQLSLDDLWCNEHDVWLIDVIDGSESDADGHTNPKKLKNVNARRQIPIHSALLRLGLIEWRDALRAAGYRRLFPELKYDENKGYGKAATKWFSGYLARLGMPRDGRKVFHSFRHTMGTHLENQVLAPLAVTKQILGHERGESTTVNTYRKDMVATGSNSPLVRLLESVDYPILKTIAPLDHEAGLLALTHALNRKDGGRGAVED